jgi:cytochrome c oxidase assembly protein Cox11
MFFSEEKNQKTFVSSAAASRWPKPALEQHQKIKVFCFFSSERKTLP